MRQRTLVIALALAVVAAAFVATTSSATPRRTPAAVQQTGPTLRILSPRADVEVAGPDVEVHMEVRGVELAPQRSRAGAYILLRLDDSPPVKAYSDQFKFQGVQPGNHLLRVELRRSDDTAFNPPVRQQVRFAVRSDIR